MARDAAGRVVVGVAATENDELLLATWAPLVSAVTPALVRAALDAAGDAPDLAELEPAALDPAMLRVAARPAAPPSREALLAADVHDGRWLWAAALALLGFESWLRRRPRALPAADTSADPAPPATGEAA